MTGNEVRTCRVCQQSKSWTEFHRHVTARDGIRSECKVCCAAAQIAWRDRNLDQVLNNHLVRQFGITLKQFRAIEAEQGGLCAICRRPPSEAPFKRRGQGLAARLVVDHDHASGAIRGLLCATCNSGLGNFRDNADALRSAAKYLEQPPVLEPRFELRSLPENNFSGRRTPPLITCGHPERKHKARGRCASCDRRWRMDQPGRRTPTCGHPDRLHASKGRCEPCVSLARRVDKKRRLPQ